MVEPEEPQPPRESQRWAAKIRTATFRSQRTDPEFCALVTLARAVNAIHFVLTPLLDMGLGDDPKVIRARYNSLAFTCALFAEVVPLVEGMQRYFKSNTLFQKVAKIVHSKEARELRSGNIAVRNKLVFHFDAAEVKKQMSTLERENPTFVAGLGPTKLNIHYELADLVTLRTFFGPNFPNDLGESRSQLRSVAEVVVSFLKASDDFLVAVMAERGWVYMEFYD
jgi:hypothetical protein